jgi:hypothetical protein
MKLLAAPTKRTWCYVMKPQSYDIHCDLCGGVNIEWSEFNGCIWCYDCQIDTMSDGGIFSGPIPKNLCQALGISFDRYDFESKTVIKEDWK